MRFLIISIALISIFSCNNGVNNSDKDVHTIKVDTISDWEIFYLALVKVESNGDPSAIGKTNDAGLIQITPIYVKDANRILKQDKFTLECRFSPELSREMFDIMQSHYNKDKDIKKAIKLHNPRAGSDYQEKILKEMESIRLELNEIRLGIDSINSYLKPIFK